MKRRGRAFGIAGSHRAVASPLAKATISARIRTTRSNSVGKPIVFKVTATSPKGAKLRSWKSVGRLTRDPQTISVVTRKVPKATKLRISLVQHRATKGNGFLLVDVTAKPARWRAPAQGATGAKPEPGPTAEQPGPTAEQLGPTPGVQPFPNQLWSANFETGDFSQLSAAGGGSGLQVGGPDRLRVVSPGRPGGSYAARAEVRNGDSWNGTGTARAEMIVTGVGKVSEGDVREYSWSTMWDPTYPRNPSAWQIAAQWHSTKDGYSQPTVQVFAKNDDIGLITLESDHDGNHGSGVVRWQAPMARGTWHDFRLRVKWSEDPSVGWVEFWHNGVLVTPLAHTRTLIPGYDAYPKWGLYRSPSIVDTGVIYYDNLAISAP